jgi:hypothetical protein
MALNLTTSKVIGFFALPSPKSDNWNEAAQQAWAEAGPGAGSCAHCGTAILHHVVVRLADGSTAYIGTACAEKIGDERTRVCVRNKLTDEQLAEREAKQEAWRKADEAIIAQVAIERAARYEALKDIIDALREQQTDFHSSLAEQLTNGPLSWRQADFVCKAMFGRRNKKNAESFDAIYDRVQEGR